MPATASSALVIPDLADRAVLVTGASTGIGAALALAYAKQKCRVALHYNASREAAERLAGIIRDRGGEVFLTRGDFSVSADVERVVEESASHFGRLDGLVNNAGGMLGRVAYAEQTQAHYDAVMDLNARSVLTASRKAIPWLKRQGGFIVNTSSIAARNGAGGGAGLYGSAKAFVSNVTRGMAKELIGFGIRVNAVAPGTIATPFHERYSTDEQMKGMVATIPQGRAGTAEDCVGAYLFLSSDLLSGYITGQVIEVNGGQLMP
ncbi:MULTISPECIES: SDR family oxidoreductase [unclassified Mesorhizobium]|uniref:SDR family NAD(P)-dependent oxidoreductase n=1 Tax=unclassified Mesorhizobium TaxID=325217 RepID=UPI000FC99E17|nr:MULTISPECIES: SDR family oxidoreductase [unclassified Mesorhizobium]RUW75560.1 SDR family oxidoreductase [Mesorhizobium sp. M4B.F.Ca.ET.049.02.1.2]RVD31356.1 SDR family oxidoreductase [Mesorhizobium sp. M4B.F.Ca.ET.017.02.2.1]RWC92831.1 MAG: SDR family oxidoreductase [Mesorhizobium sp.]TGV28454.1 SDR family oxidoreductase [Mesorhizobium sp. M4B.F.Ca.ET.143.01.1.1]TIW71579.1 MAG: SDR family oxidoreductase [Mesorhizobium sp.]